LKNVFRAEFVNGQLRSFTNLRPKSSQQFVRDPVLLHCLTKLLKGELCVRLFILAVLKHEINFGEIGTVRFNPRFTFRQSVQGGKYFEQILWSAPNPIMFKHHGKVAQIQLPYPFDGIEADARQRVPTSRGLYIILERGSVSRPVA